MAAQPLAVRVRIMPACRALGVSRATFYRRTALDAEVAKVAGNWRRAPAAPSNARPGAV